MQICKLIPPSVLLCFISAQAIAGSCSCDPQIKHATANTTDACSKTWADSTCTLNEVGANKSSAENKERWISRIKEQLTADSQAIGWTSEYPRSASQFSRFGPFTTNMLNGIIIDSVPVGTNPSFIADVLLYNYRKGISFPTNIINSYTSSDNSERLKITIGRYCISYTSRNSEMEFTLNMLPGPLSCANGR